MQNKKAERSAQKKLLKFLNSAFNVGDASRHNEWEACIETWADGPWGFRIAEIGIKHKTDSACNIFIRCDSENILLFQTCEELVLQWAYQVGPQSDIKEFKTRIRKWLKKHQLEIPAIPVMPFEPDGDDTDHLVGVAKEFSKIIKSWLTKEKWRKMRKRNAMPKYIGTCASYDFCDANEALLQAINSYAEYPDDGKIEGTHFQFLFNNAPQVAKALCLTSE